MIHTLLTGRHISSRFSVNSKAFASELLENHEKLLICLSCSNLQPYTSVLLASEGLIQNMSSEVEVKYRKNYLIKNMFFYMLLLSMQCIDLLHYKWMESKMSLLVFMKLCNYSIW